MSDPNRDLMAFAAIRDEARREVEEAQARSAAEHRKPREAAEPNPNPAPVADSKGAASRAPRDGRDAVASMGAMPRLVRQRKPNRKRVNVWMTAETAQAIARFAEEDDVYSGQVIEEAIRLMAEARRK